MTVKDLAQYRSIKQEIKEIDTEIESYKVSDTVTSSSEFPYSPHAVVIKGYSKSNRLTRLIHKRDVLNNIVYEIEEYVDNIDDSIIRRVINYKFIKGTDEPSWQEIALKIGGNNADSIRMRYKRFFDKNNKN